MGPQCGVPFCLVFKVWCGQQLTHHPKNVLEIQSTVPGQDLLRTLGWVGGGGSVCFNEPSGDPDANHCGVVPAGVTAACMARTPSQSSALAFALPSLASATRPLLRQASGRRSETQKLPRPPLRPWARPAPASGRAAAASGRPVSGPPVPSGGRSRAAAQPRRGRAGARGPRLPALASSASPAPGESSPSWWGTDCRGACTATA